MLSRDKSSLASLVAEKLDRRGLPDCPWRRWLIDMATRQGLEEVGYKTVMVLADCIAESKADLHNAPIMAEILQRMRKRQ